MTTNIDLADAIGARIAAIGNGGGFPSAGMVLTDLVGGWTMQGAQLSQPKSRVPYAPGSMRAVEDAIAQVYPRPRTSPFAPQVVIGELEQAFLGTGLAQAVDKLSQLNWPDRRTVLNDLAKRGPTLGGVSYLSTMQPAFDALPNVDTAVRAAWMAARLIGAIHETTPADLQHWLTLTTHLVELPVHDMIEVMVGLGIQPGEAEGLAADMIADLDDLPPATPAGRGAFVPLMAGMVTPPGWFDALKNLARNFDRTKMDFLEFNKPERMPYGYFIGTAMHTAIAMFYRAAHGTHVLLPSDGIWTNSTPVESIFNFLRSHFSMGGDVSDLGRSAALTRPDIFELVMTHGQPPGWVYEIKPAGANGEGLAQATAEASMYAAVLNVFSIPALPGPPGQIGTFGTTPAPGGWVAFASPTPGAIVYKYIKVPSDLYALKFPQTADAREQAHKQIRSKIEAAVLAGAATATVAAIAAAAMLLAQLALRILALLGWLALG